MARESEYEELMRWSERLDLLANVQGRYLDALREQGFDSEQSFQMVRDWSYTVLGWTTVAPHAAATGALPGEPYLLDMQEFSDRPPAHGPADPVAPEPLEDHEYDELPSLAHDLDEAA